METESVQESNVAKVMYLIKNDAKIGISISLIVTPVLATNFYFLPRLIFYLHKNKTVSKHYTGHCEVRNKHNSISLQYDHCAVKELVL